jgi:hypothetical protein
MIENYKFKYRSRGKWFFVPNEKCERRGRRMLAYFKRRVAFPDYMYHFKKGGHVAALHAHLNNRFFFKIDIQNFYYSIARMRVTRALREWGFQALTPSPCGPAFVIRCLDRSTLSLSALCSPRCLQA